MAGDAEASDLLCLEKHWSEGTWSYLCLFFETFCKYCGLRNVYNCNSGECIQSVIDIGLGGQEDEGRS